MDFWEVLYTRRAHRRFAPVPVPDGKLERIMEAARIAPSDENLQFSRYIVVRDPEMKNYMADHLAEMKVVSQFTKDHDRMLSRMWYLPEKERLRASMELTHGSLMANALRQAPAVLVACYTSAFWDFPGRHPEMLSLASTAIGVENMWLAATEQGLGTCHIGAPLMMDERRRELIADGLGVPRSWTPYTCLPIGVPAQERAAGPPRFPIESLFFDEQWGRRYIRKAFRTNGKAPKPTPVARAPSSPARQAVLKPAADGPREGLDLRVLRATREFIRAAAAEHGLAPEVLAALVLDEFARGEGYVRSGAGRPGEKLVALNWPYICPIVAAPLGNPPAPVLSENLSFRRQPGMSAGEGRGRRR
ncbi:MAG: nitroreductase family protein [Halobacteria archaeon]